VDDIFTELEEFHLFQEDVFGHFERSAQSSATLVVIQNRL